jgi:ribosomal protein S18 acetylase RimI-like enzyme
MIRKLTASDWPAVKSLLAATGNFTLEEIELAHELVQAVVGQPAQTSYFSVVAEIQRDARAGGTGVVGFLLFGPTPATTGTWNLYWIAVSPDWYGTGVAQALEGYAENFVRSQAGYWLIAETSGQPRYGRTRAFYQKQRYQPLSCITDYYRPGDDLIIYGKRLDNHADSAGTDACDAKASGDDCGAKPLY